MIDANRLLKLVSGRLGGGDGVAPPGGFSGGLTPSSMGSCLRLLRKNDPDLYQRFIGMLAMGENADPMALSAIRREVEAACRALSASQGGGRGLFGAGPMSAKNESQVNGSLAERRRQCEESGGRWDPVRGVCRKQLQPRTGTFVL